MTEDGTWTDVSEWDVGDESEADESG